MSIGHRPLPVDELTMLGSEHAIGHPALTDAATGLANRLHFEVVYSYLFEAGDRGVALTAMLVSVGVSDEESHDPELLHRLGEAFGKTARTADLAAHLGHGRFVVLLIGTNRQGALIAADRFYRALSPVAPAPLSFGIAAYHAEMRKHSDLLEAADRALRWAEENGGGIELV